MIPEIPAIFTAPVHAPGFDKCWYDSQEEHNALIRLTVFIEWMLEAKQREVDRECRESGLIVQLHLYPFAVGFYHACRHPAPWVGQFGDANDFAEKICAIAVQAHRVWPSKDSKAQQPEPRKPKGRWKNPVNLKERAKERAEALARYERGKRAWKRIRKAAKKTP